MPERRPEDTSEVTGRGNEHIGPRKFFLLQHQNISQAECSLSPSQLRQQTYIEYMGIKP